MNENQLNNTRKGYLKSTNGPLLKAMHGKELYSVLSLLKKEKKDGSFSSNRCGSLGVGKEITKYMGSPSLIKSVGEGVKEHKIGENYV